MSERDVTPEDFYDDEMADEFERRLVEKGYYDTSKYDLDELEMYFFGGTCTLPVDKRRAILRDLLILAELRQMPTEDCGCFGDDWCAICCADTAVYEAERRVAEREKNEPTP